MKLPDVLERYGTPGINPVHTTPEQVMAAVREESPHIAKRRLSRTS